MDLKLIAEILIFLIIAFRIYILESFNIKSAADKIFALYYLKNHYPVLGYIVLFYILEIIIIQITLLKIVDIVLVIIFTMEMFLIYRHIFIAMKTDDREDYIDILIKRMFKTLTYSEYQEIKNELYKPLPKWKLYLTEMMVFFFAIWSIEIG
ncbi:MAG: excinuclease ABC subunit A [Epsilonproteobacteria bacterium]|nr:excinuclease ABC subunit A [Campylobacterota bacterium]